MRSIINGATLQDKRQRTEDKGLGWKAPCVQQPTSFVLCLLSFVLEFHCFRCLEFRSLGVVEAPLVAEGLRLVRHRRRTHSPSPMSSCTSGCPDAFRFGNLHPYLHVQHLSYRGDGSNFGGRPTVSLNRRLNHSSSSGLTLPSRRLRLKKRSAILTLPMH